MRAMLIKGNLEEYELTISVDIPFDLPVHLEYVKLAIRTSIPIYMCENSEDFEDHIKLQFPIFSAETEVISKEYAAYTGQLEIQLDMECEQPRYFVEIDHETVKYGELILTEEFGYCLLMEVSSSIFDGVIDSICIQEMGALKPARKITKYVSTAGVPKNFRYSSYEGMSHYEDANLYKGVFDDAE